MGIDRSGIGNYSIVTSSTRPGTPAEGQMIYETDTNLVYYYDGAAWRLNGVQCVGHSVLGSPATSVSVTLPTITNGAHLRVLSSLQHATTTGVNVGLRFNADSGSNYTRQYVAGTNTTASAGQNNSAAYLYTTTVGNESANRWTSLVADVIDYASAVHKTVQVTAYNPANGTTGQAVATHAGFWASTAAITSVTITTDSGNFATNSKMSVYVHGSI